MDPIINLALFRSEAMKAVDREIHALSARHRAPLVKINFKGKDAAVYFRPWNSVDSSSSVSRVHASRPRRTQSIVAHRSGYRVLLWYCRRCARIHLCVGQSCQFGGGNRPFFAAIAGPIYPSLVIGANVHCRIASGTASARCHEGR
jgi:hypothetical protein